jgi:hypothetical protein
MDRAFPVIVTRWLATSKEEISKLKTTMPKFTFSRFMFGSVNGPGAGAPNVPQDTAQDMEPLSKLNTVGMPGPNK